MASCVVTSCRRTGKKRTSFKERSCQRSRIELDGRSARMVREAADVGIRISMGAFDFSFSPCCFFVCLIFAMPCVGGAPSIDLSDATMQSIRSDLRAVDMDRDGNVGFTISTEIIGPFGGDTCVVQRFRDRLEGRFADDETILGTVRGRRSEPPSGRRGPVDDTLHPEHCPGFDPSSIRERLPPLPELLDGAYLPGSFVRRPSERFAFHRLGV
jgi:hypothetical protein